MFFMRYSLRPKSIDFLNMAIQLSIRTLAFYDWSNMIDFKSDARMQMNVMYGLPHVKGTFKLFAFSVFFIEYSHAFNLLGRVAEQMR